MDSTGVEENRLGKYLQATGLYIRWRRMRLLKSLSLTPFPEDGTAPLWRETIVIAANPPAATMVPSVLRLSKVSACGAMRENSASTPRSPGRPDRNWFKSLHQRIPPSLNLVSSCSQFLAQILQRIIWTCCFCILTQEKVTSFHTPLLFHFFFYNHSD